MVTKDKLKLFKQIFSDAKIIDIDLSRWDKSINIYVVSDHVESNTPSRLSIFIVEFFRVKKFSLNFDHYDIDLEDADHHIQWNVDDFSIGKQGENLVIILFGGRVMPRLEVFCEDVEIHSIDNEILDKSFPGWNDPFKGFVRPSLEECRKLDIVKRKKHH